MSSKKVQFKNANGQKLAGKLELPLDQKPRHFALFAHCFTCGNDLKAVRNIALRPKQAGIAVLNFLCYGLGQSEGDYYEPHFRSNLEDLKAAADF